jgi:hypothetical protein
MTVIEAIFVLVTLVLVFGGTIAIEWARRLPQAAPKPVSLKEGFTHQSEDLS